MTARAFKVQMDRLMGLKFAPAKLDTHWEALSDLSDVELDAAVSRAAKECDEFPSPKMLRVFVDEHRAQVTIPEQDQSRWEALQRARSVKLPDGTVLKFTREWRCYCNECGDTGLRSFWCGTEPSKTAPWLPVYRCERAREHYAHEWVQACPCAETNPDVQRKKAQAQQVIRKQANGS